MTTGDTTERRSMPYWAKLCIAVGIIAVLILIAKMSVTPAATVPVRSAPATTAAQAAPVSAGTIPAGVWLVGTDVQPGTYRSVGPTGSYCMWSRHSSIEGGPFDDIIASDGSPAGQMLVTIQPTDKLFRTHGCAQFTKIG